MPTIFRTELIKTQSCIEIFNDIFIYLTKHVVRKYLEHVTLQVDIKTAVTNLMQMIVRYVLAECNHLCLSKMHLTKAKVISVLKNSFQASI